MKKLFALILSLILVLSLSAGALADARARSLDEIKESGKLVIGVFSDKKPFGYVDEYGEYQGYVTPFQLIYINTTIIIISNTISGT